MMLCMQECKGNHSMEFLKLLKIYSLSEIKVLKSLYNEFNYINLIFSIFSLYYVDLSSLQCGMHFGHAHQFTF